MAAKPLWVPVKYDGSASSYNSETGKISSCTLRCSFQYTSSSQFSTKSDSGYIEFCLLKRPLSQSKFSIKEWTVKIVKEYWQYLYKCGRFNSFRFQTFLCFYRLFLHAKSNSDDLHLCKAFHNTLFFVAVLKGLEDYSKRELLSK